MLTKTQNLKTPVYGIYLGPVEGRFPGSPNFAVRQSNNETVLLQGIESLADQFQAIQIGTEVKVEFKGLEETEYGNTKIVATVSTKQFVPVSL
jgi:hypothetical protein